VTFDGVLDWRSDLLTTYESCDYNTVGNFHTLQIFTAHTKSFGLLCLHSRSLVTAFNSGILQLHRPRLLFTDSLTTLRLSTATE
jgi:hypothetical protein